VHILTPGVLDAVGPLQLSAGEEETVARELEAGAGRAVAIGRGEPLMDNFQLVALDRERITVTHVYFDATRMRAWQFARNRARSTAQLGGASVAEKQHDARGLQQRVLTYSLVRLKRAADATMQTCRAC
jgi:hypothetical protein